MNEELKALLEELATIHAHLDNDRYSTMDHWHRERDRVARLVAEYYMLNIYDGGEG